VAALVLAGGPRDAGGEEKSRQLHPKAPEARGPKLRPDRYEPSLVPALSYDSDRGVGFGALGTLARFREGYYPFRWRLMALIYATAKQAPDGGVELPFHDYLLKLELPGLQGGRLRLDLKASFSRFTTCGYYGIGNASEASDQGGRYHQYDRIYPHVKGQARARVLPTVFFLFGGSFTYNWVNPYEGSRLEQDLRRDDPDLRELLLGAEGRHPSLELNLGWAWDTRNHEYVPSRGMFHEISWRFSPGATFAYGGLNLTARFYWALYRETLVLAARALADLLVGEPPFYELAQHGGLYPKGSPGGGGAVRGVPLHRYHGKVKLLGNLELRARLLPFSLFGQRFNLGGNVFFDAGRVWTELPPGNRRFDGDGPGLKLGVGAGPRMQWGETFLIRIDLAWSPDADPVGVYFDVSHVF
jgi:hypothetical protein